MSIKFKITNVLKEFDNVSRIYSDDNLELDIHDTYLEIIKNEKNNELDLTITKNITNINDYDYVNSGKVFKITNDIIYASFGGLLMSLKGHYSEFKVDDDIFLCIN